MPAMSTAPQVIQSPYRIDIPVTDIATYVFSSGNNATRRKPQFFDADTPSRCFSLAEAETYVKQVASGLQKLGLKHNDKVLLHSGNSLYFPILLWGVVAAGCVFTAANPAASRDELEYQLRDSDAELLITHPCGAPTASEAAHRAGLPDNRVYLFSSPGDQGETHQHIESWTRFWCSPEEVQNWEWHRIKTLGDMQSTTAVLNYSSGTTGTPKGVEITHYNLISNSLQLIHKRNLHADTTDARCRKSRLATSGERWLAAVPMYHAYGQTYFCLNAALLGAKVYIMRKYSLSKLLLYLDTYRITFLSAVPVILTMMAKYPHPDDFNLQAIESVVTGSAPLNPDIGRKIQHLYLKRGVTVKQGLGMTECTCSLSGFAPYDVDDGKSVGWLNANCSAKFMPVEGQDFSSSVSKTLVAGELWVSGPNIMKGYYKKPKETAESIIHDGDGKRWLKTGDIGYVDSNGRIYLVDRLKELIKVKGLQVSPTELENALLAHPGVSDAAVIGAKINDGEYPRAFVVRKYETLRAKELEELIASKFARHKWLTGGVIFTDRIPRTGSGKVIRRELHKNNVTYKAML